MQQQPSDSNLSDTVSTASGFALDAATSTAGAGANGVDNEAISTITMSSTKPRNVRLIYCGDGVVEECDEDDQERLEQEKAERERKLDEQRRLDLEAKNMKWMPWMGYMINRTANRSLEAADYAGEKLAWWFGITKPKFLYEIEEFNRMKKEQLEQEMRDDATEEIHIGVNNSLLRTNAGRRGAPPPGTAVATPEHIEMAVVDETSDDAPPQAAAPAPTGLLQM